MSSPCTSCVVRPICQYYCKKWFRWADEDHIDFDKDIGLEDFLKVAGDYGPIKNYYQNAYTITTIKFEKVNDYPINVRICLHVY